MKALIIRVARKISLGMSFLILILLFFLVVFWHSMVFTTPVGHTSIVWHRMLLTGERRSRGPLAEGLHIIAPWDVFYTYDLRLQKHRHDYAVVSKDGLHFDMELIFRWRVIRKNIRILNQSTGADYLEKMLVPEMGSVTRWVVANYTAEALYTAERSQVQIDIYDQAISDALPNGIGSLGELTDADTGNVVSLVDVLINRIELPEKMRSAIEIKMIEAQVVAAYQFVLEREKLEKERKKIEAEGIRVFQETVAPAISESFLRWRGIEATLKLSQSPNTKVVVIGNSATGLPLILDTGEKSHPANDIRVTPLPQTQNDRNSSLDDHLRNYQTRFDMFSSNQSVTHPANDIPVTPLPQTPNDLNSSLDDRLRDYQTAIDTFFSNQSLAQPAAAAKKSKPVSGVPVTR